MAEAQTITEIQLPVGVRGLTKPQIERALARYQEVIDSRQHKRTHGAKLPRATETRPYRFCVQDVVLAIWTMEHRKDESVIGVDVFLTSEVYEKDTGQGGYYDELAGATAATLTILSEAFRVGIPLRVRFGKTVEDGCVPLDIVRLAVRHGVRLEHTRQGRIEADEGRALYLALAGFSPPLRRAIDLLARQGLMSPERAAFIVHHGVWSLQEIEGIILSSPYPDLVLSGEVMPEQRHLYQHVLTHSRLALMGGLLDRSLMNRDDEEAHLQRGSKRVGLDVEDDERDLDIRTYARFHGREYVQRSAKEGGIPDAMPLPDWECERTRLQPGERLSVLLRPRVAASLDVELLGDIEQALARRDTELKPKVVAVAVPFDFHDLEPARQEAFRQGAATRGVVLMVCPETTRSLDQMAQKKMIASRIKKD
ncbi:MAG: hypothetical protein WCL39_12110 [Armatimonadota bacterium]